MKITEIKFGTGKTVIDQFGLEWEVYHHGLLRPCGKNIKDVYSLVEILEMNFEEQVDWSKVEVDTPILVSNYGELYLKRHFAKFENGIVYTYRDGMTSWTANGELMAWKKATVGDVK